MGLGFMGLFMLQVLRNYGVKKMIGVAARTGALNAAEGMGANEMFLVQTIFRRVSLGSAGPDRLRIWYRQRGELNAPDHDPLQR